MALLVDGGLVPLPELRVYDSSVLDVASVEQVDLTAKLDLVQRQAVEDMSRMLRRKAGSGFPVEQVVATESVRRWWAYRALEMIYRDVYFSQLNDRYGERWHTYERLAVESERQIWQGGLGRNFLPMPRPPAPGVTLGTGTIPAGSYFVAVSWVNSRGEESSLSRTTPISNDALHGITVSASGAPVTAIGFYVYAGVEPESLSRQSSLYTLVGTPWVKSNGALIVGTAPGDGQAADEFYVPGPAVRRG
jgi:hypothetical protein